MPSIEVCAPGSSAARYRTRASALYRMSLISVDLPEPLTPVTVVSTPSGSATSMSLRLFSRAPLITSWARVRRTPRAGCLNRSFAAQVGAGERAGAVEQQVCRRALENHVAAVLARSRTQIDHVVGRPNCLLVVLDDDHRVAEIAQPCQRGEQRAIVALMKADGRLVEHVKHAGQIGADLRGETDALAFSARQCRRTSPECQISDTDIVEEMQPIANFAQDAARDERLAIAQLELVEHADRLRNWQVDVLRDRPALDPDRAALRFQPLAAAGRARTKRAIRLEVLLLEPGAFFVAPAQVRHQPFEPGAERILLPARFALLPRTVRITASTRTSRAEKQDVPNLFGQPAEGQGEIDTEGAAQGCERLANQFAIPLRPGSDRSILQRQRLVWHKARGIEVVHGAKPLAVRTRAVRRVEGEGPGRHLRHADAAVGACEPPGKQAIAAVERVDDDDVVGEVQRDLDRFGQPAFDAGFQDQPIDDDLDRVVAPAIQLDVFVERAKLAVDPDFREAARPQPGELFLELTLAAADDRREDVHPLIVRRQHHHVDDALERLRRDRAAAADGSAERRCWRTAAGDSRRFR